MFQYTATSPHKHKKLTNIIAIDFDNVIHDPNTAGSGKMGMPMADCKLVMDKLVADGYKLVIWSLRSPHATHLAEWLDYYDIPYHDITSEKPDALVYLDDKAIRFTSWEQASKDIELLAPLIESLPTIPPR